MENLGVHFRCGRKIVRALDGVDLFLGEAAIVSLAGESGCGKTTLARTIVGFHAIQEGSIYFKGKNITEGKNKSFLQKNIQIVFQNPFASMDPRYTVFDTLFETLNVFNKIKKKQALPVIEIALKEVELDCDVLLRYAHQLSGGQVQRICIARSLMNNPSLVILDEPTSSLDITTASKIIRLLKHIQESRAIAFLFISHNLKLLKKISDFCFIMYYGRIVEYGPKNSVYNNPLHPYTRLLLRAAEHKLDNVKEPAGRECMVSFPADSGGCSFSPRCPVKTDNCGQKYLPKKEAEPGHFVYCCGY